jgi:hypothetical protein
LIKQFNVERLETVEKKKKKGLREISQGSTKVMIGILDRIRNAFLLYLNYRVLDELATVDQ